MKRAFKFRLLPNDDQRLYISKACGHCRFVYNTFLKRVLNAIDQGEEVFKIVEKEGRAYYNLNNDYWNTLRVTDLRSEFPFLMEVSSQAENAALQNLREAFDEWKKSREAYIKKFGNPRYKRNWFKKKKRNPELEPSIRDEFKFPRFKDRWGTGSFSNQNNQTKTQNRLEPIDADTASLTVVRLPKLRLIYHRSIPPGAELGTVTISKTPSAEYYAALVYDDGIEIDQQPEQPPQEIKWETDKVITPVRVYDRTKINDMDYNKGRYKRLEVLSRRISKKRNANPNAKDSKRYKKLLIKRAKVEQELMRQRRDWHHKVSKDIVNQNPYVTVPPDDLRKLQKVDGARVKNQAWGEFRNMVLYKSEWQGGPKRQTKKQKRLQNKAT